MSSYVLEPEVAGGLGPHTEMDRKSHPPVVTRLHYQLDGWLGDVLLETFPVFITTADAKKAITDIAATGVEFDDVEITTTEDFREMYPDRPIPPFVWLKPNGQVGRDDFSTLEDGRLVVSERMLGLLQQLGVTNALIEPLDKPR